MLDTQPAGSVSGLGTGCSHLRAGEEPWAGGRLPTGRQKWGGRKGAREWREILMTWIFPWDSVIPAT